LSSGDPDKDAFFEIYKESFLEAYADIVAHMGEKPSVILVEIESAFVHFVKYDMGIEPSKNLKKAKGHLFRATLDCYKLIWRETHDVISDIDVYRAAYNGSEEELLEKLKIRRETTKSARRKELELVGSEDIVVFELWKKAAKISLEINDKINRNQLEELKHLRRAVESKKGKFATYGYPAIMCGLSIIGGFILAYYLL